MVLDVPLIRQPKDSVYCGIAATAMILKYYGINESFDDIKSKIKIYKGGTYAPQLGTYILNTGFDVEIVTMHPAIFTKNDEGKNSKDFLLKRFESLYSESKSRKRKIALRHFMDFLENGGRISVRIPDKTDVVEEIKNKRPVLALLTANFLSGNAPDFDFHFNVITGIENTHIFVNDPKWNEQGGKHKYLISDFFFGIYASSYGDIDNACLIKVRKKE